MQTKNGIELNIKESKYIQRFHDLTFYFSSVFYKNKFNNELENYIKLETIKIYNKYKNTLDLSEYFAISLYKKIEKRGFYVVFKDTFVLPKDVEFKIEII